MLWIDLARKIVVKAKSLPERGNTIGGILVYAPGKEGGNNLLAVVLKWISQDAHTDARNA